MLKINTIVIFYFLLVSTAFAGINGCYNENGTVYFTDKPCKTGDVKKQYNERTGHELSTKQLIKRKPKYKKLGPEFCSTQIGTTRHEFLNDVEYRLDNYDMEDMKNREKDYYTYDDCFVSLKNNIVISIFENFERYMFSQTTSEAFEKYGQPLTESSKEVGNLMGARFMDKTYFWSLEHGMHYFISRFSNKLTESSRSVSISEYPKELMIE